MIPYGVEIFVALEPIDLRLGLDRLSGLVSDTWDARRVGRAVRVSRQEWRCHEDSVLRRQRAMFVFERLDRGIGSTRS
jgi:hypothetical protein